MTKNCQVSRWLPDGMSVTQANSYPSRAFTSLGEAMGSVAIQFETLEVNQ